MNNIKNTATLAPRISATAAISCHENPWEIGLTAIRSSAYRVS
jgi:hypothetical protein